MKTMKIAGAGISGLTCALVLAKAGYPVVIFEKEDSVGKRFHGDLQGLENWSLKQDVLDEIRSYGIETTFEHIPIPTNSQIWTEEKKVSLSEGTKHPLFYLVQRGPQTNTLDSDLYEQAKDTGGVEVHFDTPITDFSKVDIVATGPIFKDEKVDGLVDGYVFETDNPDMGILILNDEIAPDGYAYFMVMNNKAVLATVLFNLFTDAHACRHKLLKHLQSSIDLKVKGDMKSFSGTGNFFLQNEKVDMVATGEAGGLQDYTYGFGMRYAIQSGYLAAQSIIKGQNYHELLKTTLNPRLKASVSNRFIYRVLTTKSYDLLVSLLRKRGFRKSLHTLYSPQWWHSAVYPLASLALRKNIHDPRG